MLGFRDSGQFVKGQCTFHFFCVYGVKFSSCSDLNENGLKLLHVIQGAKDEFTISQIYIFLAYSFVILKVSSKYNLMYLLDSRGQRSALEYRHSNA